MEETNSRLEKSTSTATSPSKGARPCASTISSKPTISPKNALSQIPSHSTAPKYLNRYRIESNRRKGWDYANNGAYFITIVTAKRRNFFGHIEKGKMILNEMGKIADTEWWKCFEIRKELSFGEFVIMPNHIHTIVILDKNNTPETLPTISPKDSMPTYRSPKSISSFVAGYKSAVLNRIDDWIDSNPVLPKFNKLNPLWQRNYHDHIIRDETEYIRISKYIVNNPMKWEKSQEKKRFPLSNTSEA